MNKKKIRMTAKWLPMMTTWSNRLEREVPDEFSKKYITLEVSVYGLDKEECYRFFSDLENRINGELAWAYGEFSFDRCSEYGVPDEGVLIDTASWKRCCGQVAEQKNDIMQGVKETGKELLEQYLQARKPQEKEKK